MKIHEAFPSEYLKAADLNGKAVRVTIASVAMAKLGDDTKPVVTFVGKTKTLVLNVTNANRIVEATGTDETDEWEGWSITLYPAKVDFQGRRVDAIRVDDRPGASKPPGGKKKPAPVAEVAEYEDLPEVDDSDIPF